jgi:hypothetical protein
MENQNYFRVTYENRFIKTLTACTKWEAVDKVYAENISQFPSMKRQNLNATKLK